MSCRRLTIYVTVFVFSFIFVGLLYSQPEISVNELVNNNIQAAGGSERLAVIENFSFKAGSRVYYMSAARKMKITDGKEPVITDVILVTDNEVKKNSFSHISQLKGLQKETYQALAKLACGFFTLKNFKGELYFQGLKSFGPKKHYNLTSKINNLEVNFFLDSKDYLIRRMVLKGYDSQGDKYEINYDFGPYQKKNGLKLPSSWFQSQVGTRGRLYEISEIKFNLPLTKDFFAKFEVNIGQVKVSDGVLAGNIIDFSFQRNMLIINTNWTSQSIKQAGFKHQDKLILSVSGMNIDLDFYDSRPPREALSPGAKLMMSNRGQDNYMILLWSKEYQQLADKLEILSPIQVKGKT